MFQTAVQLFQSSELADVFRFTAAPRENWPIEAEAGADLSSADGALLLEEIQRILMLSPSLTQHQFVLLQRIARYGGLTISAVMGSADWDRGSGLRSLVRYAYGWDTALASPVSTMTEGVNPESSAAAPSRTRS